MNFLKNSFVVSICTLIVRIFGFIRDMFFAKYLGTGVNSDVFLTAFKLPNLFRNVFAEGAFNPVFVPMFSNGLVKDGKEETERFSRNLFSILLYALLIFTLIIELFMPFLVRIIAPGFVHEFSKYSLSIKLSRITFPYLIFISLVSFLSGILNSLNKFACVSICPVILNITFIFFCWLAGCFKTDILYTLSYAVVVGGILQLAWLFYFSVKNKVIMYPVYPKMDKNVNLFFSKFVNSFIGCGVLQINSMIDTIMASGIVGGISYIYYSDRIIQLPLVLIGTALSIGVLPHLAQVIASGNNEDIAKVQDTSILVALFFGLPAAVGIYVLSEYFIPVLFQRGEFGYSDSLAVISLLKIYAFALPLFILNKIVQAIFYAHNDTRTPMHMTVVSLIVNVILNYCFMKVFSYRGIVLSTAIASLLSLACLSFLAVKQGKLKISDNLLFKSIKILYCTIVMYLILVVCKKLVLDIPGRFVVRLGTIATSAFIAGVFYLFLSNFIGVFRHNMFSVLKLGSDTNVLENDSEL